MAAASTPAGSSGGSASNGRVPMHLGRVGDHDSTNGYHAVLLRNRMTALLVDGDRTCRVMHKSFLRYYGVETEDVDNGQAAVDRLASGANFSLIIIDISLPLLNGLEATRQIRAMGVRSKILGMSVRFREVDRQAFIDAGADKVLAKPLSPEIIVQELLELDNQL